VSHALCILRNVAIASGLYSSTFVTHVNIQPVTVFPNSDSPRSDAEKERDRLREELRQIKGSARSDQAEISAIVNKELSAKLGQVNSFLEVGLSFMAFT